MYSFDVFDTLITRTTATPKGIFALMQDELLRNTAYCEIPDFIKENFFFLRTNAQELAGHYFRHAAGEEITLEQIYETLAMNGSLSATGKQLLIDLEIKTEYNNVIAIPENINKIKELMGKGEHVVLISDMYLDYESIRSMLVNIDPFFEDIKLYLSSDIMKCKGGANLYRYIRECENVEYHQWFHMGDNASVDIQEAKQLGINTKLYTYEALTSYEQELISGKEEDAFLQLTIGAARNTRLIHKLSGTAEIGCSLGGVILFPYVWWLLQRSIEKGIQRLYFIARDGYVLKKIADLIIKERCYNIDTFYLYGSRRAWRMASISERNNDIDKFLIGGYLNNAASLKELGDVFQLTADELAVFLPAIRKLNPDLTLSPVILDYIKREIKTRKDEFVHFLSIMHKERRNLVEAYIKQEIDFTDDNYAFVELAGSGLTQGCLAEMMHDFYPHSTQTFYFKLDCVRKLPYCIFYNFFPSYLYLHITIEMLARAPHGQTTGYQKMNDRIEPVLENYENQALIDHGFNEYLSGIELYTKEYLKALDKTSVKADRLEVISAYMRYITRTPDKMVMEFIGGMPNNVTGREKKVVEYAPVLSNKDLRAIFLTRMEEPMEYYYPGTALDYSILRSGAHAAKKVEFYQKHYHTTLGRLARAPKSIRKVRAYKHYDIFPYEILEKHVVLYGAGKVGRSLYKSFLKHKSCSIVQWVDVKYEEQKRIGLPVTSPEEIGSIPYDQIVIAMLNEQQADIIANALIQKGVPKNKIIWMNLRAR